MSSPLKNRYRPAFWLVCISIMFTCTTIFAADDSGSEYDKATLQGLEAAKRQDWGAAVEAFTEAWNSGTGKNWQSADTMFNLALAYDRAGDGALPAYAWYSAWMLAQAKSAEKSRVAKRATELHQQIDSRVKSLSSLIEKFMRETNASLDDSIIANFVDMEIALGRTDVIRQFISRHPKGDEFRSELAMAMAKQGHVKEALAEAAKIESLGRWFWAHRTIALYTRSKSKEEAHGIANKMLAALLVKAGGQPPIESIHQAGHMLTIAEAFEYSGDIASATRLIHNAQLIVDAATISEEFDAIEKQKFTMQKGTFNASARHALHSLAMTQSLNGDVGGALGTLGLPAEPIFTGEEAESSKAAFLKEVASSMLQSGNVAGAKALPKHLATEPGRHRLAMDIAVAMEFNATQDEPHPEPIKLSQWKTLAVKAGANWRSNDDLDKALEDIKTPGNIADALNSLVSAASNYVTLWSQIKTLEATP